MLLETLLYCILSHVCEWQIIFIFAQWVAVSFAMPERAPSFALDVETMMWTSCVRNMRIVAFHEKCVDCDEFDYCQKCVEECQCGQGPQPHYVCKNGYCEAWCHMCKDTKTPSPVCSKYGSFELACGSVQLCPEHRVTAKKRRKELVELDWNKSFILWILPTWSGCLES